MPKRRKYLSRPPKKRKITDGLRAYNENRRAEAAGSVKSIEDTETAKDTAFDPLKLTGRRVVNIVDIFQQIKDLDQHSPVGCTFSNMEVISESRQGMKSAFVFCCNMCQYKATVWSEKARIDVMDVNTAGVSGTITTGGGHAQLEEFLGVLNIPTMTHVTFKKFEEKLSEGWAATAAAEMEAAAEEESRLAREHGEVDKDGVPLITVVADGAWCKRSYRTNYSSLSGVAAIVGYRTRKVLFIGVKNKYCTTCARAESKGEPAKDHTCYKNWGMQQSSTSMEASIICEGFKKSEELYGVRYAKLIADGDSSVYKRILESRPYKHLTVEKIECKNHLLRNTCTRLKNIAAGKTQKPSIVLRKKIGENVLRCRMAVVKATEHRSKEKVPIAGKIERLRQDIMNIPSHVFGEHKGCKQIGYFCKHDVSTAPSHLNLVPQLTTIGLYSLLTDVFRDLSRHSKSLLTDVNSNYVEHYNSIVAKFIGGKRINFANSGSYRGRCFAAVVQHNSGLAHYKLHKSMFQSSPGTFTKSLEAKRKKVLDSRRSKKRCRKSLFTKDKIGDKDYGLAAERPDIDESTMKKETEEFLMNLKKTPEEFDRIQRETVEQSDSGEWLELRRNILTASNFGRVCKMRPATGCESTVKQLLYSTFDCEAMEYGRKYEDVARSALEAEIGQKITQCGLFIDRDNPFLGASPDGLINEDAVVEIKCPSSCKEITPDEAILKRKVTFWTINKNGTIGEIQKSHNFYYQIQGQLHVTKRKYCVFALWTSRGLKTTQVQRDDEFWLQQMFPKLKTFYMNCLLPELVDPRHCRSLPIRNPPYILEAQQKEQEKKSTKNSKHT